MADKGVTVEQMSKRTQLMLDVSDDVLAERERQNEKWGHQRHPHEVWLTIAIEEVGETAQAIQALKGWGKETDASNLYEEAVQAAAVLQAFAEQVKEEMEKRGLSDAT